MFKRRVLGIALTLAVPIAACTPTQKPRTPAELSAQEQFQAVLHEYPAVGAYLVETDTLLDALDEIHALDFHRVVFDPAAAARIQEGQRVAECLRAGLRTCPRVECSTPAQQCASEPPCEDRQDEVDRITCQVQEGYCRSSSSLRCQILVVED